VNSSFVSPTSVAGPSLNPSEGHPRRTRAELQDWFGAYGADDPRAHRHLLIMRFAVVNLVAVALLAAAWLQGWLDAVLLSDTTGLVLIIVLVFLAGLILCSAKVLQVGAELDRVRAPAADPRARVTRYLAAIAGKDGPSRALSASALKLKLASRIAVVRHIAGSLVLLGLIGTVIGFMIALSGVDPEQVADVSAIGPMVSTLISGMSVALSTTLVGAVLNIWLMVNYRLLESGTTRLLTAIVELGERHAEP
jgi:uncharacterized membrane protein (DUF485 family)